MKYFDHNATTPLSPPAREAWLEAVERYPGNPSSPHRLGSRADYALDQSRESMAGRLGVSPLDLIWTSGATEASNMVFHHMAGELEPQRVIWISSVEHPCVHEAALRWFANRVRTIPVSSEGVVDWEWMEKEGRRERPGLIAVMAANNETGVIQPWQRIRDWCGERGVPYFCDAAQWVGKYPTVELGACDWTLGCAHKFGGPKGVGFLKGPRGRSVRPLLVGGPQELHRRAGTENVAGVLSMEAALADRERWLESTTLDDRECLRAQVEEALIKILPEVRVLGERAARLWNTLSLVMPSRDCRFRWVVKLDRLGFAVSTGSACSSGKEKPSHVLQAMGLSSEESGRVIRCSSGPETTWTDWSALLDAMKRIDREVNQTSSSV